MAVHYVPLIREAIWKRQFELAFLPRWQVEYFHSAFAAYFSGALCRIGYSENVTSQKKRSDRNLGSFFAPMADDRTFKHEAERNLDFLGLAGEIVKSDHLELWLSDEDREAARVAPTSRVVTCNDFAR
jgi:hypothetical protein